MYLKKVLTVISIIILIFPYAVVHAAVNEIEDVVEDIKISDEKMIENVVLNEVDNTEEVVTEEIVNETTNIVTNTVINEINNEIRNEIKDEVIVNEINDSNVVVNEVKDNSVIEKETYKEKDEIKEAIVGDDEFNNVLQDRPYLSYKTHVQNRGWEKGYREDGEISGSTGSGLRLEAIEIYLKGIDEKYPDSDIEFSTYVDTVGWNTYSNSGGVNGSIGRGLRLEALKVNLLGSIANDYDIYYRVHVQNYGWLKWTKNGEMTGVVGKERRMEALELMLVKKGEDAPDDEGARLTFTETPIVSYTTHVQNIGWQKYVQNGQRAGTQGKGYRLEGIKVKVMSAYEGDIEYAVHVQNIGDQAPVKNDEMAGTSGRAFRLERIWIKLTGELAEKYDVYYRVHSQNFGDLHWASNGNLSGTEGYGFRLEGIEIKLVEKGKPGPVPNTSPFHKKYKGTITIDNITENGNVYLDEEGNFLIKGTIDTTDEEYKLRLKVDGKVVNASMLCSENSYETTVNLSSYINGKHEIVVDLYSRYGDKITGTKVNANIKAKKYKGMMNIVTPFDMEVATIPDLTTNKSELIVKGWAISDDSNATVNLYMDGNLWLSNLVRTNELVADVEGYEEAKEKTAKHGFIALLNIEKLSIGTHVLRVEIVSKNGDVIDFEESRFQINRRVFKGHINLEKPVNGYINQRVESTEIDIKGWVLNTDKDYRLEIYYDDILIADNNNVTWKIREDVTTDKTGLSEDLVNSIEKPGFEFILNTAPLVKGRHVITVKTMDRWGNVLKEVKSVIRIEEEVSYGVDLSYANKEVDWDKLSEKGVSFAIIRVGYWKESTQEFKLDDQFERNYEEAKKRNIKVGSYLFSYAFNAAEGRTEAEQALNHLRGKDFELPIFIDVEWGNILKDGVWGVKVTKDTLTDAIVEFCSTIENNGFDAGVYANKTWFENYIDTSRLNDYDIWLANYTWDSTNGTTHEFKDFGELPTLSNYGSRVDIWQYTSSGKLIDNVDYFDLNVAFKKYL